MTPRPFVCVVLLLLTPLSAQSTFNGKTAAEWMEQMKGTYSEYDRDYAQWALSAMGERSFRVVTKALADPDTEVKVRALELCVHFGGGLSGAVRDVEALLGHPDARVQVGARAALLRMKARREDLPRLVEHLGSDERVISMAAARTIAAFGADAAPAVPALADLLGKAGGFYEEVTREHARPLNEGVHLEVARALGRLGPTAAPAVPALVKALGHPAHDVRAAVIAALGEIGAGARAAIPDLVEELEDPDWRIRREAAITLGRIAEATAGTQDEVVQALAGQLSVREVRENYVRATTCLCLKRLGPEAGGATPALIAIVADADDPLRESAIDTLGAIGPAAVEAVPALRQIIEGDGPAAPVAVRALVAISVEEARKLPRVADQVREHEEAKLPSEVRRQLEVRRAIEQLASPDERKRTDAILEMSWSFMHEAVPALVGMLDGKAGHRLECSIVGVLGDLGARETAARIRPMLDDLALSFVAAYTLARFVDGPSLPRLLGMLADPTSQEHRVLAWVLAFSGVKEVAPFLERVIAAEEALDHVGIFAIMHLQERRLAVPLRKALRALEGRPDVPEGERRWRRSLFLMAIAHLDPEPDRELLAENLDDRHVALALARIQEPRAFPVLLAAGNHAGLNPYVGRELVERLDGVWLAAEEHQRQPVRKVCETIAKRAGVVIEFSPAVSPEHLRERRDLGEAYQVIPRGMRLRASQWLDGLESVLSFREAEGALGWLPVDGKVRIVTRAEGEAFWRNEADRRARLAAPASRPAK